LAHKRVAFFGEDYLESNILRGLYTMWWGGKHERTADSYFFVGDGGRPADSKPWPIREAIEKCDVVVVTISENYKYEIEAARIAAELGKKLVVVALSYGGYKRGGIDQLANYVSLLFVIDEEEALQSRWLYKNARVIPVGHPEWETFSQPKYTDMEVRERVNIPPYENFILVAGEKELAINIPLAVAVLEAVAEMKEPEGYKIVFAVHPGHSPLPGGADLRTTYQEILGGYLPNTRITVAVKGEPFGIGTPDMVAGADLVISANSTVLIQAAHLGVPAIAMMMRGAFRGMTLPNEHKGWWPPCDRGAVLPIYGISSEELGTAIVDLLNPEDNTGWVQLEAQKKYYPPREIGYAYATMKAAIDEL
jgi:hypothetical protein